jgi:hypothetical protein
MCGASCSSSRGAVQQEQQRQQPVRRLVHETAAARRLRVGGGTVCKAAAAAAAQQRRCSRRDDAVRVIHALLLLAHKGRQVAPRSSSDPVQVASPRSCCHGMHACHEPRRPGGEFAFHLPPATLAIAPARKPTAASAAVLVRGLLAGGLIEGKLSPRSSRPWGGSLCGAIGWEAR